MKKVLLAGAAVAALTLGALPATAADIANRPVYKAPVAIPVVYNWTGFYIGVSGGGGWGTSEHTFPGGTHGPFDTSGGLVGGTVGYNWQAGNWVFGAEADFSWADIKGTTAGSPIPCLGGTCGTTIRDLGTARGRIGYAWDSALLYGTGGFAWGNVHGFETGFDSGSSTNTGWTVGGGLEYGFTPNLSAKIEYLYVDLGNDVLYGSGFGSPHSVDTTTSIVRAGLNYRFNWGAPVVAKY